MQRHALRSVCSRTRPELEQASDALRNCIRQFSTTQLQAANPPNGPGNQNRPAPAGAPKVLNVKSLPLRGRGGFRGRGALRGRGGFTGRGGSSAGGPPRSSSPVRGGGFRGRGRGGARGRGRGGKKEVRKRDDDDKDKTRGRGDQYSTMDPDERHFDDAMRYGTRTEYTPSLTLESIVEFAPAVPGSAAGNSATVLQNLSVLGTADHVGAPQAFQARHYASEVETGGLRFFADAEAKKAAEKHIQDKIQAEGGESKGPAISDAEEAVRKVITQKAVSGQHETPKFATDPVGVSRSWHLRAETYTTSDVNAFEKKLTSLLVKKGGNGKQARA
ncbi:hypothetical protein NW754_002089 [Fusarium falciforme]|uniref:Uncharacterized protein n=1 Tax=Fusarium falciforme TaxID=195108 RepID=A0A9W8RHL5_9HYPO|nr:Hypothetical protein NCS54_00144000 [Fusarium falciforme]KAJ4146624.1 hypothetical protein NW754_002089 [Fusarium falciforme]KAJ4196007.1 hypothetical protein NW755_002168 [Fusarium falciforme]KAJ4260299.1 hypothetical protein NW757_002251 [Fusarium falciforme]WAO84232.1 Hypothetical protein NCS54_00144000 [Fusarium falciforme]